MEYLLFVLCRYRVAPACQRFSLSDGMPTCQPGNNDGTLLMDISTEYICRIFVSNVCEKLIFKKTDIFMGGYIFRIFLICHLAVQSNTGMSALQSQ